MRLKTILFFFALILSISLSKEEKTTYFNNHNQKSIIHTIISNDYYLCNQKIISNNVYCNIVNLQNSNYYIKNTVFYNIPEDKILVYPKTKTKGLFRISNMIQKNIYLYHSLNKLGST